MPRSIFSMTGVAVILSALCLAAGYRQQLPSAGFGIESDVGAGTPRHILEPCAETLHLHPPVLLSGNASVHVQRGASSLAFTLSRAPSVLVVPIEGFASFPHKEKIWKENQEPKMAPWSSLGRLATQAYQELTVFGMEVMLGAAVCVAAALQRRMTRASL
mmetsp:Transcript_55207/g.87678  ORF Transcript_55207/g.87678 Transcript_55207/m.87678 type:complete len:160 (-) Transcript_55207:22-501(-)